MVDLEVETLPAEQMTKVFMLLLLKLPLILQH
jgi:hypothetical protein